ncbi:hypothetical protein [Streptomyces sp. NPDC050738]|uniref:hypothetical protein n=1 Tax=Streptomyces sp. NPDC050738 TaxID=3154744 RepID=UPI003430AEB3
MNSTRRIATALAILTGTAGLAVPAAQAAPLPLPKTTAISATDTLDNLGTTAIPTAHKQDVPAISEQLNGLDKLNELHQATDLAAPLTNLVPSVQ